MSAHTTFKVGGAADYFIVPANEEELSAILGKASWIINRYKAQIKNYKDTSVFKRMLERCQETDANIKTGLVKDIVGVELLIVEFSG